MKKLSILVVFIYAFSYTQFLYADARAEFQVGMVSGDPELSFAGVTDDLDVDTGMNLGGSLWWDGIATPNLSLGVSVNRTMEADFSQTAALTFLGVTLTGTLDIEHDIDTLMVNAVFRDNSNEKKIHPYIGGGIGIAKTDADVTLSATVTVNGQAFTGVGTTSDDDTSFAAQFMGGVDFEITENVYVGANMGYFMTEADLFGAEVEFDNFRANLILGVTF